MEISQQTRKGSSRHVKHHGMVTAQRTEWTFLCGSHTSPSSVTSITEKETMEGGRDRGRERGGGGEGEKLNVACTCNISGGWSFPMLV